MLRFSGCYVLWYETHYMLFKSVSVLHPSTDIYLADTEYKEYIRAAISMVETGDL